MSKKILVVSTDFGTEKDELVVPVDKLRELGHEVTVVTPNGKPVQTVVGDKDWDLEFPVDGDLASHMNNDYDVLLLPGGTVNADNARLDDDVLAVLKKQAGAGRAVAAICHAPWTLIDAGLARDKNLTSYVSVRIDLENAGANWQDVPVQVCDTAGWKLITSRNPGDLDPFIEAIDQA
ncbi:MAG: type 1 glutamine amidotransferase [Corynebacterium sp.]|nr:type 1 glutamine amidotransferase [Corynebacterium sp.]